MAYLGPRFSPDPEVPGVMFGDPDGSWTHFEEPQLVRERERRAIADMVRAAEPLIFGLLCKSYTRKVLAEKITRALAAAIEARGRG